MNDDPDHSSEQHGHMRSVSGWIRAHGRVLVAATVLGVGAVVCFGAGVDRDSAPVVTAPDRTITSSTATTTTSPTTVSPSPSPDAPAPSAPPMAATPAEEAVLAFAREFGSPGTGPDDWWGRVSQWSSPRLAELLATTDWRRLDRTTVTGVDLESGGVLVADFVVSLDDHTALGVRALFLAGDWRVDEVAPMRTDNY